MPVDLDRRNESRKLRRRAADLAHGRPHEMHLAKGVEEHAPYAASFTKGLEHDRSSGLVSAAAHFEAFVAAIDSGDPNGWLNVPRPRQDATGALMLGKNEDTDARGFESPTAGFAFELQGPDARVYAMPAAPRLASNELAAEMAEVYGMAMHRDTPFALMFEAQPSGLEPTSLNGFQPVPGENRDHADTRSFLQRTANELANLPWFFGQAAPGDTSDEEERARRRFGDKPTLGNLFRGNLKGDRDGPYLSQFLLKGNGALAGGFGPDAGMIAYGAHRIDQRVRVATPGKDFMTTWDEFLDVQDGAWRDRTAPGNFLCNGSEPAYRFIATPRDLATYVHFDALYQAYLNALLVMLGDGVPADPGIPYHGASAKLSSAKFQQEAFALFGGPHILSLLTEVASRALKAVRHQKFGVHRRARPEAVAGLLEAKRQGTLPAGVAAQVQPLEDALNGIGMLNEVFKANGEQSVLLKMAFPEGSPMHPAYGAGHATVAGACVTVLKAWFDCGHELVSAGDPVYVPRPDGEALLCYPAPEALTVEGELNKLASNISIGRNMAGVHYFTDYAESIRLGERIAIGILEEQALCYLESEDVRMTVPRFYPDAKGKIVNITKDGLFNEDNVEIEV